MSPFTLPQASHASCSNPGARKRGHKSGAGIDTKKQGEVQIMKDRSGGWLQGKGSTEPGKYVPAGEAKISGHGENLKKAEREANIAGQRDGLKKAVEDQEQAIRMHDLLKRTVVALSALAKNESADVFEKLADFKNSVQKMTAIEEMDRSLRALRDTIAKSEQHFTEQTCGRPELDKSGTSCEPGGPVSGNGAGHSNELQSIFLGLIAEFDHDFGEDYSVRLTRLREQVGQVRTGRRPHKTQG